MPGIVLLSSMQNGRQIQAGSNDRKGSSVVTPETGQADLLRLTPPHFLARRPTLTSSSR